MYDKCKAIVTAFIQRFEQNNPGLDEAELVNAINNGYCYALAVVLQLGMSTHVKRSEIVRSRGHWFFRMLAFGEWVYFDAWMSNGTRKLTDITDSSPEDLEVWSIDDVVTQLDSERVLEYIGVLESIKLR